MLRRTLPLLLLTTLAACEDVRLPWADPDAAADADAAAADSAFHHHIIFVAPDPENPLAGVLDFAVTPSGDRMLRSAQAWIGSGESWDRLLAEAWRTPRVRAAGRILPGRGVRVLVGDTGQLESLRLGTGPAQVRLQLGETLGEWTRQQSERIVLRAGAVGVGDQSFEGAVLHYTGAAAFRRDAPEPPGAGALQALLTDAQGGLLVLVEEPGAAPLGLWLERGDTAATALAPRELRLHPAAAPAQSGGDAGAQAGAEASAAEAAPSAWQLVGGDGAVLGTLEAVGAEWTLEDASPGTALLQGVRGTVELDGRERTVFGVIRRGRD